MSLFRKRRSAHGAFEDDATERQLLLAGRTASWQQPRGQPIGTLADVEFRVFSQWGEDGILEWLAAHVPVPVTSFVEFGVETFREANCRFLMMNRNWRGLVMDGSADNMAALRRESLYWRYSLTAAAEFVTAENIDALLQKHGVTGPLGVLSVDIDGNDYWVWKATTVVDPAIVVCEVNPIFGDTAPVTIPYDPAFTRFAGHPSGLYFGSSIGALRHLAGQRGYEFLGTSSSGINAFFVKRALAQHVAPLVQEARAWPSRHRDSRNAAGELDYAAGAQRFERIRDLPVVDVTTGRTLKLGEIGEPYSPAWRALL